MAMHFLSHWSSLKKMRLVATGLLIAMACLFVVAHRFESSHAAIGFVRAFAEAALVGALADWFAVTALFRHPLGLPIPHTAIIQKNKDRIGASVAGFLEQNFMTHAVVSNELRQLDFVGAVSQWIAEEKNSTAVARQIVAGIPAALRLVDDDQVGRFIRARIDSGFRQIRVASLLADVLTLLLADRQHQELFDQLLTMVSSALQKNHAFIRQKIHEHSPRWMPRIVDDKFFIRLLEGLGSVIDDMREPESEWRARFQKAVEELVEKLRSSPEYEVRIATLVDAALAHPDFHGLIHRVWQDLRRRLLDDIAAPQSRVTMQIARAISALGVALESDPQVREKLNDWLREWATNAVVQQRGAIAALVERVIGQWDAETVAQKFEHYIGSDLQYIRINGTMVGGLVGVLLHLVTMII
jgi:uncharacterized membrane-anchored protein YjiN (DUF445 family)